MPKTILIADDSPLIRKTLCEFFEADEDYDICAEATNGQEAIDLALKHRPDLIILDVSMPVMNGLQASRELKRIMPTVPIILFTLYADSENERLAADLLVDKVVSKGLKGHCKTGHAGSVQNRPWEGSRNLDVVLFRSLVGQV